MRFRLWKLGSLEHKILPNDKYISDFIQKLNYVRECGGDVFADPTVQFVDLEAADYDFVIGDLTLAEQKELNNRLTSAIKQFFDELVADDNEPVAPSITTIPTEHHIKKYVVDEEDVYEYEDEDEL